MVDYSYNANKEINRVNADNLPITLLEITHPDLAVPARVVKDREDVVFETNTYTALAFEVSLPSDLYKGLPRAKLQIDNVGSEIMQWIESSGGGVGTQVRFIQILRNDPGVIEFDMTMTLSNITVTPTTISGTLGFDDLLNLPAVTYLYTPSLAPGLF